MYVCMYVCVYVCVFVYVRLHMCECVRMKGNVEASMEGLTH
jgi:hypothetical protein